MEMHENVNMNIAIIGGGIMGLSVGVALLERFGSADNRVRVTIYAEALTPNTTGDIAAGLWGPSSTIEDPRILKWGKETYDYLYSLLHHPDQDKIGVSIVNGYNLEKRDNDRELPFWGSIPLGMRRMSADELTIFPGATGGWTYLATICEGVKFNAWLLEKFQRNGGTIIQKKINAFSELVSENFDLDFVINCCGLGARSLCNDSQVFPIRGQVRRVRAPWIKHFILFSSEHGSSYVIPNTDCVVLGGTAQRDDFCTDVRPDDLQHILNTTSLLIPSLAHAQVVADQVGLRPGRTSVRLEYETIELETQTDTQTDKTTAKKTLKVIHNYGHGGSGYTLFYGCAQQVVEMLTQLTTK